MRPLVTLAVPTLNRPEYLRETIASVLAQDYENLEIVISDNGSRDQTPDLVQQMIQNDPRARFRRNPSTVPLHEHFRQCVEAARGEFFVLVSDDDLINSTFVSELAAVAVSDPGITVVVPTNVLIDDHGAVTRQFTPPEGTVFDGCEFVCDWLYQRTPQMFGAIGTVLARTEIIRQFGSYQDFARGQNIDNLLFVQYGITGRVGFAHRAVFKWRIYDASYGTTCTPRQIAESSRDFVRHLRSDPVTSAALARLPEWRRRQIINGVRTMTAQEFLSRIGLYENPFRLACIRKLFIFPADRIFWRLVFGRYYHELRRPQLAVRLGRPGGKDSRVSSASR